MKQSHSLVCSDCPWSGRVEALHPSVQASLTGKALQPQQLLKLETPNSLSLRLTQVLVWGDCLPLFFFFLNTHISAGISEQRLGLVQLE